MKPMVWRVTVVSVLMLAATVFAAPKKGGAENVEPAKLQTFTGVTLTSTTNAQGDLTGASIQTSARWVIVTNGMDVLALKGLVRLNDKAVDMRGEATMVGKDMAVKVVGPIKDVTPSLNGMTMVVTKDKDNKLQSVQVKSPDGKYLYAVPTDKMDAALLSKVTELNGKPVDVEGQLSQIQMRVTISGIREAKPVKKTPPKKK